MPDVKMATSQEKIAVYNLADLKNTSDDAIPNYLNSLKFEQSHRLTDVRLALGYSAFAISAACFLWDYKFGFESTKYYTAIAVALYTALNGALTFWIWAKEKGTVYTGTAPSGEIVTIATSTAKKVPEYQLTVTIHHDSKTHPRTLHLTRSFTDWFDSAGHFVVPPFQSMLATSIPPVGKLDPKRVAHEERPPYTTEMLDALAIATATASATGSATAVSGVTASESTKADARGEPAAGKKGGKRRKGGDK